MTILIGVSILTGVFGLLWVVGHGLPESMRWMALRLLVEARRLEEGREERARVVDWALEEEAR